MSSPAHEALRGVVDVSRETLARLDALVERLTKWSRAINLVSPRTVPDAWRRHVLDSAQLWPLAPDDAETWIDLGAGAGFPGLVIAAIAAERRPSLTMTLVESDARKCAFMAEAARVMGVRATILHRRIEGKPDGCGDVVSARALAPLPDLLALAAPWLAGGGVALLPKGREHQAELTEAAKHWHTRTAMAPSITDPSGVILVVSEIRRAAP